jgi:hypothetical protein
MSSRGVVMKFIFSFVEITSITALPVLIKKSPNFNSMSTSSNYQHLYKISDLLEKKRFFVNSEEEY